MDSTSLQQRILAMKPADKIMGTIIGLVVLGGGGYGFWRILPILIDLAQNTIYFFGELVVLAILAMIFLDKNTWVNLYYAWKNVSRKIRKAIVSEDPIGVLDTVIHRYAYKLDQIDHNVNVADAARKRQEATIKDALKQRDGELNQARAAQKLDKKLQVEQHATAAQRWEESAKEMEPMLNTLTNALTCLQRARDLCQTKLEDVKNQQVVLQRKLEALLAGQQAVRSIKTFFGSNPDLDMQELAIDEIERQATEAMAEIDQFMRVMNPVLESADLKRSADQMAAMEHFNSYITSGGGSKLLTAGPASEPIPASAADDKGDRYINLLNK